MALTNDLPTLKEGAVFEILIEKLTHIKMQLRAK